MPPPPQGAALHGWISAVWFGSVGGDEFDFGWGADPQTPDFMYLYVFVVIYINYLLLAESQKGSVEVRMKGFAGSYSGFLDSR